MLGDPAAPANLTGPAQALHVHVSSKLPRQLAQENFTWKNIAVDGEKGSLWRKLVLGDPAAPANLKGLAQALHVHVSSKLPRH